MTSETVSPPRGPLITVVMPTYNPEERYLREAIDSVRGQVYPRWELCVADDGSQRPRVREVLSEYASVDSRIKVEHLSQNSGISAASNRALGISEGEFIAFLDHDDALTPDALLEVARRIDADPGLDAIYSDQDKLGAGGRRVDPFFKPDWSPVYALGAMYIGHLLVIRRSLVDAAGGFDSSFDTIQDFELMLRVAERTDRIHHIDRILYHWRAIPGSIAAGAHEKSGVPALQARAVTAHLRRRGIAATAVPHPEIPHRARLEPDPGRDAPSVSVVVPWSGDERNLDRCLDTLFERTSYPSFEVIVVDRARASGATPGSLARHPVLRATAPAPARSRAAATNLGVARSSGEYLVLLADDAEILEEDWIEQLLTYADIPTVGAVGGVSQDPDGRAHDAGFALRRWRPRRTGAVAPAWWNGGAPAEPVMRGVPAAADGYYGSLSCAREVGAVSGAFMLVSRSLYLEVGGFRGDYRFQYEDVDFCLRVRASGLAVVCAPSPRIVRHEPTTDLADDMIDRALLIDSWFEELDRGDPYLNRHLSPRMIPVTSATTGWRAAASWVASGAR